MPPGKGKSGSAGSQGRGQGQGAPSRVGNNRGHSVPKGSTVSAVRSGKTKKLAPLSGGGGQIAKHQADYRKFNNLLRHGKQGQNMVQIRAKRDAARQWLDDHGIPHE